MIKYIILIVALCGADIAIGNPTRPTNEGLGLLDNGSYDQTTDKPFTWLKANALDLEYLRLKAKNRDPYAPEYTGQWREQIGLRWDISLLKYGFWNNRVHTETINPGGTVKTVGWQWELGIRLGNQVDIYHYHHSRHIMDQQAVGGDRFNDSYNQFPVEDALGIRFKFLSK
jgi:hypothetical protein